jgi:hypothetical protein
MRGFYKAVSLFFCLLGVASVLFFFPLLDSQTYPQGMRGLAAEPVVMASYAYGMFLLGCLFFFLASHFFKKGRHSL